MPELSIDLVRIDSDAQPRLDVSPTVITEYAEAMLAGDVFPPIVVYHDGQTHWLADGFHRIKAADAAGIKTLQAQVQKGDKRDAILHSVGCNAAHGLRRTPQDKRAAVRKLLNDPEWAQWSDREIARRCKVSHPLVAGLRPKHTGNVSSTADTVNVHSMERKFTHHKTGKPATMKTGNIGAASPKPVDQEIKERPSQEPERTSYDENGNVTHDPWSPEKREQYNKRAEFTLEFIDSLELIADQLKKPVCDLVLPEDREEVGQLLKRVTTSLNNVHSDWRNTHGT